MKPEITQLSNVPWGPLLGVLLYAVPLGVLRARSPHPASAPVRAADGLGMLAMGFALPQAAQFLPHGQTVAVLVLGLVALFVIRRYLGLLAGRRMQPRPMKPLLLLFRGSFLPKALRAAHLSEARVCQKLAKQGVYRVTSLFVVVYEPEGTLSWTYFSPSVPDVAHLADGMRLNPN